MAVAAILAVMPLCCAWAQQPASPKGVDIFVAEAVPVDVTAGNVIDARERGLVQGRVEGLRIVLERMVSRQDLDRLPQLSETQVVDMVRDFSIANERSSAVRYLADLTVRFDPAAVRALLRVAGIPFTETASKPLLLVPVLQDLTGIYLWDDANPWRAAWSRQVAETGLVPLSTPLGDLQDAAALTSEQAIAKDFAALLTLAQRYDVGGVMLAVATFFGGDEGPQIDLTEVRAGFAPEEMSFVLSAQAGQTRDELMAAAAMEADAVIEESWRRRNQVAFGTTSQLTALVPIDGLRAWLDVKNSLADVALIDHINVQAMTRDRAQITLSYAGNQNQLMLAMAQRDLALNQENGVWLIELARNGRAGDSALERPDTAAADLAPER